MITDDERREVARKLRGLAENCDGVVWVLIERHLGLVLDERYSAGSVYTSESVSRLADLIEPETERTCRMVDNGVELCCSECDRRHDYDDEPQFCMGCGARVVGAL